MILWRKAISRSILLLWVLGLVACADQAQPPDETIETDTWRHQEITAVVWSPDSAKLAVIAGDDVWLYRLTGEGVTRRKLDDDVGKATSVAFSSTGEQMAVGRADGLIQLWEVDSGDLVAQFAGHDTPVKSVAFNPDDTLLASGAGQWHADFVPRAEGVETRLWDVATGEGRGVLSEERIVPPVTHLAFSPDGAVLAVGQQGHGCASPRCANGRLRFWRPATDAISEVTVGHDIAFSEDGRFVAALGQIYESGQAQIWEVGTGSKLPSATTVPDGFAYDLALSRDGSTAAVVTGEYGYGGQTAYVWDVATGGELAVLESGAPIALSANGRFLVTTSLSDSANRQGVSADDGADEWLRLWDVRQGSESIRLDNVGGSIGQLAFSPDDAWLAVTGTDIMGGRLRLMAIPQLLASQNGDNGAARPSPTATWVVATVPAVATATSTPTQTLTPTATTIGVTPSATADASGAAGGATATYTPPPPTLPPWTATPISPEPTADCSVDWFMDGPPKECPAGPALTSFAAGQRFERGRMIWVEETDTFYIFYNLGAYPYDNRLVFQTLGPLVLAPGASADNRVEESPPWPGLIEPVSGFGLLWRGEVEGLDVDLRQALGWAVENEFGFQTRIQCQRQETYSARTCFLQDADGSAIVLDYHAIAGNVYWHWVEIHD